MSRGSNRAKILAGWRAQYAAHLEAHKAAHAAGEKDRAGAIVRDMRALEKAIRAYGEERIGVAEIRPNEARRRL